MLPRVVTRVAARERREGKVKMKASFVVFVV